MKIEPNKSTFIITGGASGLGEACVNLLFSAPYYANVIIVDFNEENGKKFEASLNSKSQTNKARFYKVNVVDSEQVEKMILGTVSEFGVITGLINCAGIGTIQTLYTPNGISSVDSFKTVMDINVIGTFNTMRFAVPHMVKQTPNGEERGIIINTASIAAFDGQIGQVAYAASKGAIVSMTLPIAREMSRYGIRALTIAPGVFMTPMMKMLPEKAQKSLSSQVPFPKRLGEPSEFAQLCLSIIENPMLNGTTIRIDGSLRMSM